MNLARKIANEFGRGIAAGFIISFGATVYLMMDNKIVASFLFCFGLFIVSEFDLNLYTGRIGYLATERTGAYLRYVALGLVGNFVGMLISVSILQQTRHANKLIEAASSSAASREGDNLLSLFLLGIYCGILMYIFVHTVGNLNRRIRIRKKDSTDLKCGCACHHHLDCILPA